MIQSMTGYGKAVVAYKEKKIHVEIKSLNSKQLDLNTRIAPLYREKEMEMRQMVAEALIRGKVDMSVWVEKDTVVDATPVNAALVENYYNQIKAISEKTGIPLPEDWFYTLLRMPDVLTKTDMEELEEEEWQAAREAVKEKVLPCRRSSRRRLTISLRCWPLLSHTSRAAWRKSGRVSSTVCSRFLVWTMIRTAWSRS